MPRRIRYSDRDPKEGLYEAERRIAEARRHRHGVISLSGLRLDSVPESLRELTWIYSLDLNRNNLSHLPTWIGNFEALRHLAVYDNPLRGVPKSLGRLARIESLLIVGGSGTAANEIIGTLVNLRELAIARLGLTDVPQWIQNLKKKGGIRVWDLSEFVTEALAPEAAGLESGTPRLATGNWRSCIGQSPPHFSAFPGNS